MLDAASLLERLGVVEGMKVADLGCGGAGHFTLPAARFVGRSGKVYAVDILQTVLESVESKARIENLQNIEYVWADLEVLGSTKIPNDSLDAALIKNVLFQAEKRKSIMSEAVRVIKPGGKLMIIDWKMTGAPFGPPVNTRVKKEDVVKTLTELGLSQIDEFEAGKYHYGMIFQK